MPGSHDENLVGQCHPRQPEARSGARHRPGRQPAEVARKEEADFQQGKENARIFEVTLNGRTLRGPVHIQPGLANYTVVLPLGYGRTHSGHIGTGTGFSAYALRTTEGLAFATGATLRDTGSRVDFRRRQERSAWKAATSFAKPTLRASRATRPTPTSSRRPRLIRTPRRCSARMPQGSGLHRHHHTAG